MISVYYNREKDTGDCLYIYTKYGVLSVYSCRKKDWFVSVYHNWKKGLISMKRGIGLSPYMKIKQGADQYLYFILVNKNGDGSVSLYKHVKED